MPLSFSVIRITIWGPCPFIWVMIYIFILVTKFVSNHENNSQYSQVFNKMTHFSPHLSDKYSGPLTNVHFTVLLEVTTHGLHIAYTWPQGVFSLVDQPMLTCYPLVSIFIPNFLEENAITLILVRTPITWLRDKETKQCLT